MKALFALGSKHSLVRGIKDRELLFGAFSTTNLTEQQAAKAPAVHFSYRVLSFITAFTAGENEGSAESQGRKELVLCGLAWLNQSLACSLVHLL